MCRFNGYRPLDGAGLPLGVLTLVVNPPRLLNGDDVRGRTFHVGDGGTPRVRVDGVKRPDAVLSVRDVVCLDFMAERERRIPESNSSAPASTSGGSNSAGRRRVSGAAGSCGGDVVGHRGGWEGGRDVNVVSNQGVKRDADGAAGARSDCGRGAEEAGQLGGVEVVPKPERTKFEGHKVPGARETCRGREARERGGGRVR